MTYETRHGKFEADNYEAACAKVEQMQVERHRKFARRLMMILAILILIVIRMVS